MTTWMIPSGPYGIPLYPARVPRGGVKKFYINERCLKAPVPYMVDGRYAWDPRRRVRPGLVSIPKGFIGLPDSSVSIQALLNLVKVHNTNNSVSRLLENYQ